MVHLNILPFLSTRFHFSNELIMNIFAGYITTQYYNEFWCPWIFGPWLPPSVCFFFVSFHLNVFLSSFLWKDCQKDHMERTINGLNWKAALNNRDVDDQVLIFHETIIMLLSKALWIMSTYLAMIGIRIGWIIGWIILAEIKVFKLFAWKK